MSVETQFFRSLNRFVEPAVRAGVGSPWVWPAGFVVIECKGRKTGRMHRVPVSVNVLGDVLVASTVRARRSQWLKNLAVNPELNYWLAGREHLGDAIVFAPGAPLPAISSLPATLRPFAPALSLWTGFGLGFAIITKRGGSPGN